MDLVTLGKEPIDPGQPTGEDVQYDEKFEQLQEEIEKLSSPAAVEGIDWNQVVALASEILAQKSKDLRVAGQLAVALTKTRKIEGLAIGLQIYRDLLENYWEDLFPPKSRIKGRLGALEWWVERTGALLNQMETTALGVDLQVGIRENLDRIEHLLQKYLAEPPLINSIRRALEAFSAEPDETPVVKTSPTSPAATERPVASPPKITPAVEKDQEKNVPDAEIQSPDDAQKIMRFGLQKLRQAAAFLRKAAPTNPLAFRQARIAAWAAVDQLPPATAGRTLIPAPPPQTVKNFVELRANGQWEALYKTAEQSLSQFPFWLDLNRFSAEALTSLGDPYRLAGEEVCRETAFLLYRLPGLKELSFADGTPFVAAETGEWLNRISLGSGADLSVSLTAQATFNENEDEIAAAMSSAQALVKDKKIVEAAALLQGKLREGYGEKRKLQWRLALAQMLLGTKQPELVGAHLENILQDLESFHLEVWDPELALKCLKLVWVGFNSQANFKGRAGDILARIARIDATAALRLQKTGR